MDENKRIEFEQRNIKGLVRELKKLLKLNNIKYEYIDS